MRKSTIQYAILFVAIIFLLIFNAYLSILEGFFIALFAVLCVVVVSTVKEEVQCPITKPQG